MLSRIVGNITPSATCELEGVVSDMKNAGIDVIELNAGEPDMPTPANIVEACVQAMREGKTKYVNTTGIEQLREAICRKLRLDNGVEYEPSQICVSTGAKQALNNAVMAVTNPGDEVIIPTPGWVSYVEIVKLVGGVPVCVECKADGQLDIRKIREAVTPKTAAILINTPNNPTGAVYSRESLEELAKLAVESDIYMISDEVYEKLIDGEERHECVASFSEDVYRRAIIVNGMSKAYCMTGWRIGYTAAPKEIARGINAIQGHTTSNSTTFVQWAAMEALEKNENTVREMVEEFSRRRDYMFLRISRIPGIRCDNVKGAFYLLPDVSAYFGMGYEGYTIENSLDFCDYILREARVAIVPGAAFMAPRTVRIAYTNSMERLREGMDRMEKALERLR